MMVASLESLSILILSGIVSTAQIIINMSLAPDLQQYSFPNFYEPLSSQQRDTYKDTLLTMSDSSLKDQLTRIKALLTQDCKNVRRPDVYDFLVEVLMAFQANLNFKPVRVLEETAHLVFKNICAVCEECKRLAQDIRAVDLRNSFKMTIFLSFLAVVAVIPKKEEKINDPNSVDTLWKEVNDKKKKNKKAEPASDIVVELNSIRNKLLNEICKSLEVNLRKLWGNAEVDETMLSMYADVGVKIFEKQEKGDDLNKNKVFEIFHKVIHINPKVSLGLKKAFVLLCKDKQMTDNLIQFFSKSHAPEVQLLCQEVCLNLVETTRSMLSQQDLLPLKSICKFLQKMCQKQPRMFLINFSTFMNFYEHQNYILRNLADDFIFQIVKRVLTENSEENKAEKERLIDILLERVYDKVTHARTHVIALLGLIVEENLAGKDQLLVIMTKGVERMVDISVNTRRRAIFLTHQCMKIFYFLLKTDTNKLLALQFLKKESEIANAAIRSTEQLVQSLRAQLFDSDPTAITNQETQQQLHIAEKKLQEQTHIQEHYSFYLLVTKGLQESIQFLKRLIYSVNVYDVLESIKIIVFYRQIGVENINGLLASLWTLANHPEKVVREAIINSFITLYLQAPPDEIAKSLISLIYSDPQLYVQSLKVIIPSILKNKEKGVLPMKVGHIAWRRFQMVAFNDEVHPEALASIQLAFIFFRTNRKMIKVPQYVDKMILYIEQEDKKPTPNYQVCIVLAWILEILFYVLEIGRKKVFMNAFIDMVTNHLDTEDNHQWYNFMKSWTSLAIHMGPHAQIFYQVIMKAIRAKFNQRKSSSTLTPNVLSKMMFSTSCIVINLIKITNILENRMKEMIVKEANNNKYGENKRMLAGQLVKSEVFQNRINETIEKIKRETRSMLETKPNIQQWVELAVALLNDQTKGYTLLQRVASISICNFALISEKEAERHLPLMIKLVEKSEDPLIRMNIAVGISDVISRFYFVAEKYVPVFYRCLQDRDPMVSKCILELVCDMILSETIKVGKGICYLALIFENGTPETVEMVRNLFIEMNKKHPLFVHNTIPELIMDLSRINSAVYGQNITPNTYKVFANGVLPHITKQKGNEDLIVYLINLMITSLDVSVIRNVAITLSLMNYTPTTLRKLIEFYGKVKEKIKDDGVIGSFQEMVARIKRSQRSEMKALVDQFQAKFVHFDEVTDFSSSLGSMQKRGTRRRPLKKNKAKSGSKRMEEQDNQQSSNSNQPIEIHSQDESQFDSEDDDTFVKTHKFSKIKKSPSNNGNSRPKRRLRPGKRIDENEGNVIEEVDDE